LAKLLWKVEQVWQQTATPAASKFDVQSSRFDVQSFLARIVFAPWIVHAIFDDEDEHDLDHSVAPAPSLVHQLLMKRTGVGLCIQRKNCKSAKERSSGAAT